MTRLKLLVSRRNTRKLTRADGQVKFGRRDGKGKNVTNWGTKGCCWRSTCRLEQPLDVPAPRPIARPSSFYPTSSLTHAPNARRLHLPVHLAVASQNPFLIYLFNFRPDYRDIGIRVESSRSIDHLLTRRIINQWLFRRGGKKKVKKKKRKRKQRRKGREKFWGTTKLSFPFFSSRGDVIRDNNLIK